MNRRQALGSVTEACLVAAGVVGLQAKADTAVVFKAMGDGFVLSSIRDLRDGDEIIYDPSMVDHRCRIHKVIGDAYRNTDGVWTAMVSGGK